MDGCEALPTTLLDETVPGAGLGTWPYPAGRGCGCPTVAGVTASVTHRLATERDDSFRAGRRRRRLHGFVLKISPTGEDPAENRELQAAAIAHALLGTGCLTSRDL
jgi:hypothetical protein